MPDTPRKTPAEHDHPAPRSTRAGLLADVTAPDTPDPAAGLPYRIADHDLFIHNPEAGTAPARAFAAGDRVPADLVETYGWACLTHPPEWAPAPPATPGSTSSEE